MTPSEVGERAEAAIIDALVQDGKTIYLPLGGSQLAAPRNGQRQGIRWAEQFRLEWAPPMLDDEFSVEPPADDG